MSVGRQQLGEVVSDPIEQRRRLIAAAALRMRERSDEIASDIVRACRGRVPYYASLQDEGLLEEMLQTASRQTVHLLQTLATGAEVKDEQLDEVGMLGRRRYAQGVPLRRVIDAYQVGTQVVIEAMLEELRFDLTLRSRLDFERLVTQVNSTVLELSQRACSAISDAYEAAEHGPGPSLTASAIALRRIFDSRLGLEEAEALARGAGLLTSSLYVCALFTTRAGEAPERARAVVMSDSPPAAELGRKAHTVEHDHGWVRVFEVDSPTAGSRLAELLRAEIEQSLGAASSSISIGVGRALAGVPGIRRSLSQAKLAATVREELRLIEPVMCFDHALPHALLLTREDLIEDIIEGTIGPLRSADEDGLMPVLRMLLETQGRPTLMAKNLHVSRSTLDRRLKQIEELTGRSFDQWTDMLMLGLGLLALAHEQAQMR